MVCFRIGIVKRHLVTCQVIKSIGRLEPGALVVATEALLAEENCKFNYESGMRETPSVLPIGTETASSSEMAYIPKRQLPERG